VSLKKKVFKITMELVTDMLGTKPKNKQIYASWIQEKKREQIEKEAENGAALADGTEATPEAIDATLAAELPDIAEREEAGWTGYFEDKEGPYLTPYMV
jgi:hypothetical protein